MEQVDVPEEGHDGEERPDVDREREEAAKGEPGSALLQLDDIKEAVNFTCIASSSLGVIHSTTRIKVQSKPLRRAALWAGREKHGAPGRI